MGTQLIIGPSGLITKLCNKCKLPKRVEDFDKNFTVKSGLQPWCKVCCRAKSDELRTPERALKYTLRYRYKIEMTDFLHVFNKQSGKCALCFRILQKGRWSGGVTNGLHIDHDHSHVHEKVSQTGCRECIRGLLCGRCNLILGMLEENPHLQNDLVRHYLTLRPLRDKYAN